MNATTVWSLADPVRIQLTGTSNMDLFHSVFPGSNPQAKIIKMLEAAPVQKGFSMATVWITDFPVHGEFLMNFFTDAKIEHGGSVCQLRRPTIQEYLEFQKRNFVKGLVGSISGYKDHFFYDDTEHETFDVVGFHFEKQEPSKILCKIDYDSDHCVRFLLIAEGL